MVTASELLNASDILTIDLKSRVINIPAGIKALGVESDDDVQKLRFKMPRYYNEIDLSTYTIRINYENAKGEGDVGGATDIIVKPDTIEFTWVIGRHAFMYKGDVKFVVCLRKMDADNIDSEFNTTIATLPVLEGLETDEAEIEVQQDLLTTFGQEVLSRAKAEGTFNPVKGVDYFTEAERAELVQNVIQDYNATVANAITKTVQGSIVRIDDICPIEHSVKCWVHGKNLFNINNYTTETDYSNNKTIYAIYASNLVIGRTYTVFSSTPMSWFKISNSATGYSSVGLSNSTTGFTSYTFTHQRNLNIRDEERLKIYINNMDETAMYDHTTLAAMNICIVEGNAATEYVPYLVPGDIRLSRYKRNIFNVGKINDYYHIGEISISNNSIVGTVTSSNSSHVINLVNQYPSGTYSISFDYTDSASARVLIRPYDADGNVVTTCTNLTSLGFQYNNAYDGYFKNGRIHVITIPDNVAYWCLGFVLPVSDISPVGTTRSIYNIRVEYGDGATKQETCSLEDYQLFYNPTDDIALIDIPSVSPTMTLMTNTPGAIIEVTYARDTQKAFESYVLTDETRAKIIEDSKSGVIEEVSGQFNDILQELNEYTQTFSGGDV